MRGVVVQTGFVSPHWMMMKMENLARHEAVLEMSSDTHGTGTLLSERIGLAPGLYGYASMGVSRYGDDDKVYMDIHDEPQYAANDFFEAGCEDAGYVSIHEYCVLRIEIRNRRQQNWSLTIFRES